MLWATQRVKTNKSSWACVALRDRDREQAKKHDRYDGPRPLGFISISPLFTRINVSMCQVHARRGWFLTVKERKNKTDTEIARNNVVLGVLYVCMWHALSTISCSSQNDCFRCCCCEIPIANLFKVSDLRCAVLVLVPVRGWCHLYFICFLIHFLFAVSCPVSFPEPNLVFRW